MIKILFIGVNRKQKAKVQCWGEQTWGQMVIWDKVQGSGEQKSKCVKDSWEGRGPD